MWNPIYWIPFHRGNIRQVRTVFDGSLVGGKLMGTRKPEVGAKRSPRFFRTFELVPRGEKADGPATARLAHVERVRRRPASPRSRLGGGRKNGLPCRRLEILTVSGQTCRFGKVPRRVVAAVSWGAELILIQRSASNPVFVVAIISGLQGPSAPSPNLRSCRPTFCGFRHARRQIRRFVCKHRPSVAQVDVAG